MTIGEWISAVSSFGALSAALVALFTLIELTRQRKSTYKPDLCVLKRSFMIKEGGMGKLTRMPMATEWVPQEGTKTKVINSPSIRIVNVGFGAAKHVTANWKFDILTTLDELNKLANDTLHDLYFEQIKANGFISVTGKGIGTLAVNGEMSSSKFEYLLPVGTQNSGHEIYLPPTYTLLVAAILFLSAKENVFPNFKIPKLQLELSFYDIGKKLHCSTHELQCHVTMMDVPDDVNAPSPPGFEIELLEIML